MIDKRIRDTYAKDSKATLNTKLYDAYVKFFRWASDRLGERDGVVCFVSNNSFVHKDSFDGMRKHLFQTFTTIYHLDLGGDAREHGGGNVFEIRVPVGITILVRNRGAILEQNVPLGLQYATVENNLKSKEKLAVLASIKCLDDVEWCSLQPNLQQSWLTDGMHEEYSSFIALYSKEARATRTVELETIFRTFSLGVSTNRDGWVYGFDSEALVSRVRIFLEAYNAEVFRWKDAGYPKDIDAFIRYDRIKWSRDLKNELAREKYGQFDNANMRRAYRRPFCKQYIYYDTNLLIDSPAHFLEVFPNPVAQEENSVIVVSAHGFRAPFSALVTDAIPDLHLCATTDGFQCLPFYTYNEEGSGRRENITEWALEKFRERYGAAVTKRDIFHYVYALLHHPEYRTRYTENLKRDLPRVPLVPDAATFAAFVAAGARLADLHLTYETAAEFPLARTITTEGATLKTLAHVEKMKLSKDKTAVIVNPHLTLAGVPPEAFQYRLGNRSALDWVLDQYRVSTDARSGITSDPNRPDDPEYIVHLIGQVVTVSVETVRVVAALPALSATLGEGAT